ncbi:elongation factor P hydroxylase [uncultured Oceanicoccus sp.]|uniref:elongation factor P hydroxylase n=1 Tax=uncultured Oceanicoccus sp. TaxID=1706381 RepID=UPI0030DA8C36
MSNLASPSTLITHNADDLIRLFNQLFSISENTRLVRGQHEPVYRPASADTPFHQVVFAHGFFSSALHEIAHWCIAGDQRRLQLDYGYWYLPDGRNRQQQAEFEKVEVKPQALEWIFSAVCQKDFRISIDNLSGEITDTAAFKSAVYQQAIMFCEQGFPPRAKRLIQALAGFYQGSIPTASSFKLADLGY